MNSGGIHGNFLWKGCAKVIIEHQGQALTVAMEMERRAIRTYERALLLKFARALRTFWATNGGT